MDNSKSEQLKKFDLQRKVVSHMTSTAWKNIPHVTYIYEPDITEFCNEFKILSEKRKKLGYKISLNTIFLKLVAEGLKAAPELNSHIKYKHNKNEGILSILKDINISIPWMLPDGKMITPVVPNVEKRSLNDISEYVLDIGNRIENTKIDEMLYKAVFTDTVEEIKKFNFGVVRRILAAKLSKDKISGLKGQEKANYYKIPENKRLTEKDIMCGTVTVSNIGSIYKEQRGFISLLEIIPPQIFAIGIGSIQEKPGVYLNNKGSKEIGIRKILPMCLAFDHRAVDFNAIVPFMKRTDEIFEKPSVIHRW